MRIQVDQIDVHYLIEGPERTDQEVVVLLHGWGANVTLYRNVISHLGKSMQICALDLPGFGETAEPDRSWSVADFADFVIHFIEAMGFRKVALMGHSHGGRVSLEIASRTQLPFSLTRMVLMDAAGVLPKKTWKQKLRQRRYKMARWVLSLPLVGALYPDALENLRRAHGSADYQNASPLMRQTLVKVVNTDMEPAMPKIQVPVLLIWGEDDTATPLSDGERMEKLIPGAGLVRVPHAGHYVYIDQWPTVMRVLDAYFGEEG